MNFHATSLGALVAVTAANQALSLATLLSVDANRVAAAADALLDNRGDSDCFVIFGGPDVAATVATCIRVPAGSIAIYGKGNATWMAVIGSAPTTLAVHLGKGA